MAEPVKRKRGRPRKTPLVPENPVVELPQEIEQIVKEVKQKEEQQEKEMVEEVKAEVKRAHNGGWDFTISETPDYFDADYSYELTGYKPIDDKRGLDFDPSWFTQARDTFLRTGHYTEYQRKAGIAYDDFWRQEYARCKDGMTVNGYTITGDHYYFLNYYQLMNLQTSKAGEGRNMSFPDFYVAQYQWFHYLEMAKRKRKNAVLMKARGVGQP